ncbi:MAG: tetratricopeptide repeat protein [Bacteroidetes bacterium]|nr:tetratricopeptide repeat protein [Bacteroidota bacterium]
MKYLLSVLMVIATMAVSTAQELEAAIASIRKQNYAQAEAMLKTQAAEGKNSAASFYLGHTYYLMAMEALKEEEKAALLDQCLRTHDQAIGKRPKDAFNYIGKAYYYLAKNNLTEANSQLATARGLESDDIRALTEGAIAYMRLFQHPLADQQLKRLAADNSSVFISRAESKGPDNMEVLTASGYVYFLQGVYPLAESKYLKVLAKDPSNIDARFRLAQAYYKQSKYENTEKELLDVISRDPKFAPAYREIAEFYYAVARAGFKSEEYFAKAKEYALKYRALVGDDLVANQRFAALLYFTGSYAECITEVDKLMQDPSLANNISLKRLRAYSLAEVGRFEEAKKAMEDVMSSVKEEDKAGLDYKTLGIIYLGLNDDAKATEYINKAIALDADNKNIWKQLYEKAKVDKDWTNAQRYLVKHLTSTDNPDSRDIYMASWLTYRNKDNNACITWTNKALELYPKEGDLYLYKARAYNRMGGQDQAMADTYQQYLQLIDDLGEDEKAKNADGIGEAASALAVHYYGDEFKNYPRSYKYALIAIKYGNEKYKESAEKLKAFYDGQKITPEEEN